MDQINPLKRRKSDRFPAGICESFLATLWSRLVWLLLWSQTTSTRFWLGVCSIGYGASFLFSPDSSFPFSEYQLMTRVAGEYFWATAFIVHGASVLYGIFDRVYNKILLVLEGLLGVFVWVSSAVAIMLTQHNFGIHGIAALIALWLLIRYPTHWEYLNAD